MVGTLLPHCIIDQEIQSEDPALRQLWPLPARPRGVPGLWAVSSEEEGGLPTGSRL